VVTKISYITSFPQPLAHHQLSISPLFRSASQIRHIPLASQYIFTLKMATALFVETLGNFQFSMWLIPEIRSLHCATSTKISRQEHSFLNAGYIVSARTVIYNYIMEVKDVLQRWEN
jgi:hypothetical protein